MNNLILLDFDGTITRKDTFLEIIKFAKGDAQFYMGLVLLTPLLIAYKLNFIPNWRIKEMFFGFFFKDLKQEDFQATCKAFASEKLPSLLRPSALQEIQKRKASTDRIIIVSASAEDWIKPWSDRMGIELIATHWEVKAGKLTGKIEGRNCYGPVKKELILKLLNPSDYKSVSVYGDTDGDTEMLSLGTLKYYKYFND